MLLIDWNAILVGLYDDLIAGKWNVYVTYIKDVKMVYLASWLCLANDVMDMVEYIHG